MEITVTDMRAAGKPGYVAKIVDSQKQFLQAKSHSNHGSSAKQITYELTDDGIYEICDGNFGGRKRNINFIKFESGEVIQESENLADLILTDTELSDLEGSQKQIVWAESIRSKALSKLKSPFPDWANNVSAKWWIDNRNSL
jgi:hypothetical protein